MLKLYGSICRNLGRNHPARDVVIAKSQIPKSPSSSLGDLPMSVKSVRRSMIIIVCGLILRVECVGKPVFGSEKIDGSRSVVEEVMVWVDMDK